MSNTRKKLQRLFKPPTETTEPAFAPRDLTSPPKEVDAYGNQVLREEALRVKEDPWEREAERLDAAKNTKFAPNARVCRDVPTSIREKLNERSSSSASAPPSRASGPSPNDFRKAQEAWRAAQQQARADESSPKSRAPKDSLAEYPPRPSRGPSKTERIQREREAALRAAPEPLKRPSADIRKPELQRSHPLQIERDAALRAHAREMREGAESSSQHATSHLPKPKLESATLFRMVENAEPPTPVNAPRPISKSPLMNWSGVEEEMGDASDVSPPSEPVEVIQPFVQGSPPDTVDVGANQSLLDRELDQTPYRYRARNLAREEELALAKSPQEVISLIAIHAEAITPEMKVEYLERAIVEKLRASHKLHAFKLLATAYAQLENTPKEINTLVAMADLSPNDPWPKLRLVQIYREQLRDTERALQWAEAALQTAPWHGQAKAMVQLLRQQSSLN